MHMGDGMNFQEGRRARASTGTNLPEIQWSLGTISGGTPASVAIAENDPRACEHLSLVEISSAAVGSGGVRSIHTAGLACGTSIHSCYHAPFCEIPDG